jgi:hypothetical protein
VGHSTQLATLKDLILRRFSSATVTLSQHNSGAFTVDVLYLGHHVVLQGLPRTGEFGVSSDVSLSDTFCGHDHVFATFEDAQEKAIELMATF